MRKITSVAVLAIIGIGGIYLVSSGSAKPVAPGLRVGVLVSDSGELGFVGPVQRAAARLAVRDIAQSRPQLKVELNFVDVGGTELERKRAVAKLRGFDVDLIIAPIESESARVLAQAIEKLPVPVIAPSALEDELGERSAKPWIFRLATSPSQESFALAKYISKAKPGKVLLVSSALAQSKAQLKSLAFGLVMNGIRVDTAGISETKAVTKSKPDALVLFSMEESLSFLAANSKWVENVPNLYLVPSNLADYSFYPWAQALRGAQALSPSTAIDPEFRAELAKVAPSAAFSGPRATTILNLGQRTYDAIQIAAEALSRAKSGNPESLRSAVSKTLEEGKALFDKHGFYDLAQYSVFRYGSSGTFSKVSVFIPN